VKYFNFLFVNVARLKYHSMEELLRFINKAPRVKFGCMSLPGCGFLACRDMLLRLLVMIGKIGCGWMLASYGVEECIYIYCVLPRENAPLL
jgi:hypothetical protein